MWPKDQVRGFHLARPPDFVPIHSDAAAVFEQRDDVVVGQRARLDRVAAIAGEGFGGGVEPGESVDQADPQPALAVDEQRLHAVVGQRRSLDASSRYTRQRSLRGS